MADIRNQISIRLLTASSYFIVDRYVFALIHNIYTYLSNLYTYTHLMSSHIHTDGLCFCNLLRRCKPAFSSLRRRTLGADTQVEAVEDWKLKLDMMLFA